MQVNPIDVQKHLKGMDYPARKDDVVSKARENGASGEVVEALEGMGRNEFTGPDDVMEALGR
jgi:Protein of unknown function (DUF2795)